ncbi:hypothetical protein JCM10207_001562 [Rhodosporidiobolus poonsookiae]
MRSILALLALGACTASALVVPARTDANNLKRDILRKFSKRQSVTSGVDDATVLQFALTLEHLENSFYSEALSMFNASSFADAGFDGLYPVLQQVGRDEAAHVEFLTTALSAAGATPVQACNYTFPMTDVKSFLALSQVVEGVGVSAYLGAAGSINTTAYLTAAASILTVEARHAAALQFIHGYQPAPQPNDTPLSASNVVTIVSPFFSSCPDGSAPTIEGNPALNVTTSSPKIGEAISVAPVNSSAVNTDGTVYCGFASGLSAGFSTWSNGSCEIPSQNVTTGQTYVVLTTGPSLSDNSIIAGPAILSLGTPNITLSKVGATNSSTGTMNTGTGTGGSAGSSGMSGTGGGNGAATLKTGLAGAAAALIGALALVV